MRRAIYLLLFAAAMIPVSAFAQMDTVYVPDVYHTPNYSEGTLNDSVDAVIHADSVNNTNNLSKTVFKLLPEGYYVLTGTITIPAGETLNIVGPTPGNTQTTALPMILWTSSGGVTENFNFDCYGNIMLKNVWLLYANTAGTQVGSALQIEDDSLADISGVGEHATFDNVVFDYCPVTNGGAGAVTLNCKDFKGTFTNCYFRNDIDQHLRYYGRALSFPYQTTGLHSDSVSFQNCTFANMGYVYMQEGGEYGDYVSFDHCTFFNIVMFALESGWWHNLAVTNSIFENSFMYGSIPANDTSGVNGGTITIDSVSTFGFSVPFTDQQRHILFANNSYYVQPWLVSWMRNNPNSQSLYQNRQSDEIPVPQPMMNSGTLAFFDTTNASGQKYFPSMNLANVYDDVGAHFIFPPTNLDSLEGFLQAKWSTNANVNWAFEPDSDVAQVWPMRENLSYTNDTLMHAGISHFPLGDLYHWWNGQEGTKGATDYYSQWKAQAAQENALISTDLMSGSLSGILTAVSERPGSNLPSKFSLGQNYPNPFNPTTQITYMVPKKSLVTLDVFNVLGEKVATLFSGVRQPGRYTATFNGSSFASGVYFYRLKAGSVAITKKLVLLK